MVLGIALEELKTWNQIKYVAPKREHVLWNSEYKMSALITPPVEGALGWVRSPGRTDLTLLTFGSLWAWSSQHVALPSVKWEESEFKENYPKCIFPYKFWRALCGRHFVVSWGRITNECHHVAGKEKCLLLRYQSTSYHASAWDPTTNLPYWLCLCFSPGFHPHPKSVYMWDDGWRLRIHSVALRPFVLFTWESDSPQWPQLQPCSNQPSQLACKHMAAHFLHTPVEIQLC